MSEKMIETQNRVLKLDMPDTYKKMSAEQAAKVIEGECDTQFFIDEGRGNLITVTEKDVSGLEYNGIEEVMGEYYHTYSRMIPGFKEPYMASSEINGLVFGAIEFYSETSVTEHYNLTFVTVSDNIEIVITMQSLIQDILWSRKEFMTIISTAKVEKKKDEKTA